MIKLTLLLTVAAQRNYRFRALFFDIVDEVCYVITGIGNHGLNWDRKDQNGNGWRIFPVVSGEKVMSTLRELQVDAEAVSYLKGCLADGNILAKLLLRSHDLTAGKLLTTLPSSVSEEAAREFESGGKAGAGPSELRVSGLQPKPDTDSLLADAAYEFLATGSERLCVFEDASASPEDPYLRALETRIAVYEDEVYHLLPGPEPQRDEILKTIRRARSWMFSGAFTSAPQSERYRAKVGTLSFEELELFAEKTEKIIVGAYDGEGFLIWSKF